MTENQITEDITEGIVDDEKETPSESNAEALTEVPEGDSDTPETFPREYVETLRQENARYRAQAKTAENLGQRLHSALTAATGKLQDPSDLPFDEAHLEDPEALGVAIDELLSSKPHLKSRKVTGDVGQGTRTSTTSNVDLLGMMRGLAG